MDKFLASTPVHWYQFPEIDAKNLHVHLVCKALNGPTPGEI